ncbi:MAG: hypothetical protein WA773_21130 [Bradyrhizobium sp.]
MDESSSRFDFLIEHDFLRKAANTFPDHALAPFNRRLAMPIDAASDAMALFVTHQCGPSRRHSKTSASSCPRRKRESFDFGNAEFALSTS